MFGSPPVIGMVFPSKPSVEGGSGWRVRIRYCAGCQPVPPDGNWDSPAEGWELPFDEVWITRAEWEALIAIGEPWSRLSGRWLADVALLTRTIEDKFHLGLFGPAAQPSFLGDHERETLI